MKRLSDRILDKVERYYTGRFTEHGATARGVDWNSPESQELRFRQLLRVADGVHGGFTLTDYGCGYGALVPVLEASGRDFVYRGFDLSEPMLEHARRSHEHSRVTFTSREEDLDAADFTVASGIFNVKLDVSVPDWERYVLTTLDTLDRLSRHGFAFNMLTSYSDPERMRPDLYYGDPAFYFDRCKRHYSRNVALLHDYGLYEFTIVVRSDE